MKLYMPYSMFWKNALAITTCFMKFTLVASAIKFYFISVTKCKAIMNFFSSQVHSLHFVMLRFLSFCFIYSLFLLMHNRAMCNILENKVLLYFFLLYLFLCIFLVSLVAFLAFTFIRHSLNCFATIAFTFWPH